LLPGRNPASFFPHKIRTVSFKHNNWCDSGWLEESFPLMPVSLCRQAANQCGHVLYYNLRKRSISNFRIFKARPNKSTASWMIAADSRAAQPVKHIVGWAQRGDKGVVGQYRRVSHIDPCYRRRQNECLLQNEGHAVIGPRK